MAIDPNEIYDVASAASEVKMGEDKIRSEIKAGKLAARKGGPRTTRILGNDLLEWYTNLPTALEATRLSEAAKNADGKPHGSGKTAAERGLASALR